MLGFRIPLAGFRIPKPWIPDSTDQNYLDSGFRIPDYLTWGDALLTVDGELLGRLTADDEPH